MKRYFLSGRKEPSRIYPTLEKGGRGDLNSLAVTLSSKSPSVPLCKSGMTPFYERLQMIGVGGAA
jgi:hypothetical protein